MSLNMDQHLVLSRLEDRVARLEQKSRRLQFLTMALMACLGCLTLIAADKPEQKAPNRAPIDTTALRLWDSEGNLRGLLMCTSKGNAALSFTNQQGQVGATLGVRKEGGGGLELLDGNGKMGLRADIIDDSGRVVLQFLNAKGEVTQQLPQ